MQEEAKSSTDLAFSFAAFSLPFSLSLALSFNTSFSLSLAFSLPFSGSFFRSFSLSWHAANEEALARIIGQLGSPDLQIFMISQIAMDPGALTLRTLQHCNNLALKLPSSTFPQESLFFPVTFASFSWFYGTCCDVNSKACSPRLSHMTSWWTPSAGTPLFSTVFHILSSRAA